MLPVWHNHQCCNSSWCHHTCAFCHQRSSSHSSFMDPSHLWLACLCSEPTFQLQSSRTGLYSNFEQLPSCFHLADIRCGHLIILTSLLTEKEDMSPVQSLEDVTTEGPDQLICFFFNYLPLLTMDEYLISPLSFPRWLATQSSSSEGALVSHITLLSRLWSHWPYLHILLPLTPFPVFVH